MSRYNPHHQTEALYSAAQKWVEQSLRGERSVFTDSPTLWTLAELDELDEKFVRNPDERTGTFIEKLSEQLADATPQCCQLMAELMWVLGLFPSNIGPDSKRRSVTEIWSWSGANLSADHQLLTDQVLGGIGSAGTAYNTHRWREVVFVITILRTLRALDKADQTEILADPWRFAEWLGRQEGAPNRQLLHILPHLIFPDTFERISSAGDKRKILAAFTDEPTALWQKRTAIDLDRALFALRQKLEAETGAPIDFYSDDLLSQWRGVPAANGGVPNGGMSFATTLAGFLTAYGNARSGLFRTSGPVAAAMTALKGWLETCPPIAARPMIKVRISVGQGGWTKTPWIALLDGRVTTSTQRGIYIVYLIAEDLTVTHLTLNQGMTDLVNTLGQRGAVEAMNEVAQAARPRITDIVGERFQLDNAISLHSETSAARNYELGTIAHMPILSNAIPGDEHIIESLEVLLEAYDHLIEERKRPADAVPEASAPGYSLSDALGELFMEREEAERMMRLWHAKQNVILQGPPGVGKSFAAQRLAFALMEAQDRNRLGFVQFHQSYSYEDFVEGYRPTETGFELRSGKFVEFCRRAAADLNRKYVFIIDEINRGNLSKILGELMLLIEGDKRDSTWKMPLASGQQEFFVPPNVYLLGLMNTADRSLAVVDYALRRRFAFVELAPSLGTGKFKAHLAGLGISAALSSAIISRIGLLNAEIAGDLTNLGPGFSIGHSYFCAKPMHDEAEHAWYERIIETEIVPLLREYWFDAPQKVDSWNTQLMAPM